MPTTKVPSAGAGNLIFPASATITGFDVQIKTATNGIASANAVSFWNAIDLSHTTLGWESVKLITAFDTTEQTIVDTSGIGVLTHVLAPELSGSGTMTIRVTADGVVSTFVSETITIGARMLVGDFKGWASMIAAADITRGIGSSGDAGYEAGASTPVTMSNPIQAVTDSRIGIKFKSTLKVTVQGSVTPTGSANLRNAAACYTLSIPEGL